VTTAARVLIVEDHPTMRDAMRMVLEHEGFDIAEAADGDTALAMIREHPPDVLLLDLNVPGLTGEELLASMKDEGTTASVRVVVVTATGEEGRARTMALGADAYFTKPFGPTALLRTVERVLGGSATPGS
jgi:DNA-binding response OmpR family regulator